MMKFRQHCSPRRMAYALVAGTAVFASTSCAIPRGDADWMGTRILRVDPAQMQTSSAPGPSDAALARSCETWRLRPDQAARFFRKSKEYRDGIGHEFYWLPCSIKGRLVARGHEWDFEINAAATATWRNGDRVRRWACSDAACKPLVLLMPDDPGP